MKSKLSSKSLLIAVGLISAAQAGEAGAQALPGPGGWKVEVDPARDFTDAMNRLYREQGAPVFVVAEFFDISRSDGLDRSYEERKALDERWALSIANMIGSRGFRMMGDAELRSKMGMSTADFRSKMIQRQTFSNRDVIERHAGAGLHILVNEQPPACPASDQDGYIAAVMPYYPTEGVKSEYGSLMVYAAGIGPCASRSHATLQQLINDVQRAVTGSGSAW